MSPDLRRRRSREAERVKDVSIQADFFDIVPPGMLDDITQAVLAREDVGRYLRGGHGQSELQARERIHAYLDELRTTQRYPIYRALKHPLYPILRKIERIDENVRIAQDATRRGRTSTSPITRAISTTWSSRW